MSELTRSHGRPTSWVSVAVMLAGFTTGGVALTMGRWWLVLTAAGAVLAGGVVAIACDIFSDVVLDPIHQEQADPHVSPIRGVVTSGAPSEVTPNLPGHSPDIDARSEP